MSVMSKVFYECTRNLTCKDIIHPWTESCWELRRKSFISSIPGNLKFFLPFVIIPAMLKIKSFGYQLVKDSLIHYLLVFTNSMFIANTIIFGACFWRQFFGYFNYYFFVGVNAFVASFPLVFLPKRIALTHVIYMYGVAFESVIRKNNSTFVSWLRKSKFMGTLAFMAMSGLIMDLLKRLNKDSSSVFWFLRPLQTATSDETNESCKHQGTCLRYVTEGVSSYAIVGIIFELVKYLFFHVGDVKKDPLGFISGLIRKFNSPLVRYLTLSVGFYRAIQCLLLNKQLASIRLSNFIAGVLSGFSYYFAPEYNLFNVAVTSLAQLLILDFNGKTHLKGLLKKIQYFSRKIPLRIIIFAMTFPVAVHSRIFHPYTLNRLALKCIDFTSGKAAYLAGERYHKLWLNPDVIDI